MEDRATKFDYFVFGIFEASTCRKILVLISLFILIPAILLAYLGNLAIGWPGSIIGWSVGFCVFPVYFVRVILKNTGLLDSLFKKKQTTP